MVVQWGEKVQNDFIDLKLLNLQSTIRTLWFTHFVNRRVCAVALSTLQRWWTTFKKYGMTQFEWEKRAIKLRRKFKTIRVGKVVPVNGTLETAIKNIVLDFPEKYLDEIQLDLFRQGGRAWLICRSTTWRVMTRRLGWRWRVIQRVATQLNEVLREQFRIRM